MMANLMHVSLRQITPYASEATIGRHTLVVDRPVAKGGTDDGPMGGDYFLTSVGGCFLSTLLAAIRAREAAVSEVRVEVTGAVDGSPARFTRIELEVSGGGDAEQLAQLLAVADKGCIMMNTLRGTLDLTIRAAAWGFACRRRRWLRR